MAVNQIIIDACNPTEEGCIATLDKWLKDHDIANRTFFIALLPKILFCLRNYSKADAEGRLIATLNLGETTIDTNATIRKRKRPRRKGWDCAF